MLTGYYAALLDLHDEVPGAADRARGMIGLLQTIGVLVWLPSFACAIADPLLAHGEAATARDLLEEASSLADETGSHFWSAEIARVDGEARLALGEPGGFERVHAAVERAEAQGAALLELRARTSLCRHGKDPSDRAALAALVEKLCQAGQANVADVLTATSLLAELA
jgi:predicted ATPase